MLDLCLRPQTETRAHGKTLGLNFRGRYVVRFISIKPDGGQDPFDEYQKFDTLSHLYSQSNPNTDIMEHETTSGHEDSDKGTAAVTQLANESEQHDAARHRKLRHKIDRRLMPICAWVYLINYLDRSNIGNAKILNAETDDSFMQSLNLSANDFAMAITVFSIAYSVFDVPANFVLKHFFRPSLWFSVLFFCWGVLTLAFAFLKNYASVLVVRFFIGVLEAGFYPGMLPCEPRSLAALQASLKRRPLTLSGTPGIVYYISFWYRHEERSLRIAFFSASTTLAGAFGGCIAYGVAFINRHAGLKGYVIAHNRVILQALASG